MCDLAQQRADLYSYTVYGFAPIHQLEHCDSAFIHLHK